MFNAATDAGSVNATSKCGYDKMMGIAMKIICWIRRFLRMDALKECTTWEPIAFAVPGMASLIAQADGTAAIHSWSYTIFVALLAFSLAGESIWDDVVTVA